MGSAHPTNVLFKLRFRITLDNLMNFGTTVIIFIVAAVSFAVFLVLQVYDSEDSSGTDEQPKISEVYGLSIDTVQRFRLSFKDPAYHPLSVAKDNNSEWQLTDPITTYANEGKVPKC